MPDVGNPSPLLDWYLVHARPKQELAAVENLERQGYAANLLRFRHQKWQDSVEPILFPRYLRAGMLPEAQSVHPIRSTRRASSWKSS